MSYGKPKEIPQDVWDKAWQALGRARSPRAMTPLHRTTMIARAILAERVACAWVADNWQEIETLLPLASHDHNEGARVGQYEAAERIAVAIRKREEPKP